MAYRNKYDKDGSSFALGESAENSFTSAAQKNGMSVTVGSQQDEFNHIDFHVSKDNLNFSVEVKSRKKIKRGDTSVNDELIWIEFKNVRGKRGWLYGGADALAFEREHDFVIVDRKLLARLCERLCDLTQLNTNVKMPLYTAYQRHGRQDILSLIKMSDILTNIKHVTLPK
jgi:hypothetical protein